VWHQVRNELQITSKSAISAKAIRHFFHPELANSSLMEDPFFYQTKEEKKLQKDSL
jgi:hypothetical protein